MRRATRSSYFGASAAAFALVGSYWAVMFFQPQYLQDVRGHSPILSGAMILPITVPMVFIYMGHRPSWCLCHTVSWDPC